MQPNPSGNLDLSQISFWEKATGINSSKATQCCPGRAVMPNIQLSLLAPSPDGKVLSGGQAVIPIVQRRRWSHQKRSSLPKVTSKASGGRLRWHIKALSLTKYSSEILTPNPNTVCIVFHGGRRSNTAGCLLTYRLE